MPPYSLIPAGEGYGQIDPTHRWAGEEVIEMGLPTAMTTSRIHACLCDAPYPATRRSLVAYARKTGAPDDVLRTLERLPERGYASPDAVTRTIGMLV